MFNLTKHKAAIELNPLVRELSLLGIKSEPESFSLILGDETLSLPTVADCLENIKKGINELKGRLWKSWMELKKTCELLLEQPGQNSGGLENTLFIYNIKKSYALAGNFTQLNLVQNAIRNLLYLDIVYTNPEMIRKFNALFFKNRILHKLIMREIYREKVLKKWGRMNKVADISGPWANADLEMEERVWKWSDGEDEFFGDRQQAKRRQARYNPEYYQDDPGIIFKFIDRNRDPWLFSDNDENPYPSNDYARIASHFFHNISNKKTGFSK